MSQTGPIIVIDDDKDDQEILQDVITDLGIVNRLIFFDKGPDAFNYLKTTPDKPLVILSDLNLPLQGGVEFKRQIDDDPQLRQKSIPFVFFSTHIDRKIVDIAYKELTIQGFFQKSNNYEELKSIIKLIIEYWKICKHPNSV
jgi:CheY-like chemotaxis protein